MNTKYDVFISYSRVDAVAQALIAKILELGGYTYFSDDRSISSGENFAERIAEAITNSSLFLFIASKKSIESQWCIKEIYYAFEQGKHILPIRIDDAELPSVLTFMIGNVNGIEYKNSHFEDNLLKAIGKLLGRNYQEPLTEKQRSLNLEIAKKRRQGDVDYVPQNIDVDIFISYRRVDGRDYARNIMQGLKIVGYPKIFFDFNSLRDGVFNTQILDAIYSCKDFILVISPLALKNCGREGDWVAKEIRTALKYGKKIIPIVIEDTFKDWPADFPTDLAPIKDIQFHKLKTDEYFEDSINKLAQRLSAEVSTEPIRIQDFQTINHEYKENIYYKIKVDTDCRLYIDEEEIQFLKANQLSKIQLPKGEYVRKVVAIKNENIFNESILVIEQDKAEIISLQVSLWKRIINLFS